VILKDKLNELVAANANTKSGDWLLGRVQETLDAMPISSSNVKARASLLKLQQEIRSCTWRDDGTLVC
jgi:hypothetical protein